MIVPAFTFCCILSIINDNLISFLIHSVFRVVLLNNIISGVGHSFANSLLPPYWYLGMTLQLYLFYLVWRRYGSKVFFYITIVLALVLHVVISPDLLNNPIILRYVRVNCVSWLPIFCFGCIFGKSKYVIQQWKSIHSLFIFILSLALIMATNCNYYVWFFMPYFALPLFLSLANLTKNIRLLNKFVLYIGNMSTYIFLSHPIVLKLRAIIGVSNDDFVLQMILYFLSTIIISYIYRYLHNSLIKRI